MYVEISIRDANEWDRPETAEDMIEYLRTAACVHPISGMRRMPTQMDDDVFSSAADIIEALIAKPTQPQT